MMKQPALRSRSFLFRHGFRLSPQNGFPGVGLLALVCLCLGATQGTRIGTAAADEVKPNVIIINTDDVGYGDIGAYGATKIRTPKIDRFAREGRLFTDFHSASAVCSPSRYALLTGEYPSRKGFWHPIFLRAPLMIDPSRLTIGRLMKEAGYATAAIGKWHLGFGTNSPVDWNADLKPGPLELGFDYYFGIPVLNSHPPFVYVENHRILGLTEDDPMVYGKRAETEEFPEKYDLEAIGGAVAAHRLYKDREVGTVLKDKAIAWIKENKAVPFFLYFATPHIHHPFTPDERFAGTSEAGRYGDYMHELDWMVGEILAVLDEQGLAENTLVIFTSDNGGMINQGGQDAIRAGHRLNGDLLGFKFDAWEGGHRVPFIARWPGRIPAGTESDQLLANVDLLATLAALVGRQLEEGEGPDSRNMLPALVGAPKEPIREHLVISPQQPTHLSIRKGKWIYIPARGGGGFTATEVGSHTFGGPPALQFAGQVNSDIEEGRLRPDAPPAQLYDLESDPRQARNLYHEYPEMVRQLEALLKQIIPEH
jgi:arylsulfatase A